MELVQLKEMQQLLASDGAFKEKYAKLIFK